MVLVAWVAICCLESNFHSGMGRAGPLHPGPAPSPPVLPALGRPTFPGTSGSHCALIILELTFLLAFSSVSSVTV